MMILDSGLLFWTTLYDDGADARAFLSLFNLFLDSTSHASLTRA